MFIFMLKICVIGYFIEEQFSTNRFSSDIFDIICIYSPSLFFVKVIIFSIVSFIIGHWIKNDYGLYEEDKDVSFAQNNLSSMNLSVNLTDNSSLDNKLEPKSSLPGQSNICKIISSFY